MSIRQRMSTTTAVRCSRAWAGHLISCPSVSIGMARDAYIETKSISGVLIGIWHFAFYFTTGSVSFVRHVILCIRLHGQIKHDHRDGHGSGLAENHFSHFIPHRYTEHKSEHQCRGRMGAMSSPLISLFPKCTKISTKDIQKLKAALHITDSETFPNNFSPAKANQPYAATL